MKKYIFILLISLFILPAYSQTLEGGIKKIETVQQAKDYVFKYTPLKMVDPTPYKAYAEHAPEGYRTDYSDGRYSIASGNKLYGYRNNKLYVISIYDKNVFEYPRRSYRYDYPSGKLSSTAYGISEGNGFEFYPDGSLMGIWENNIYREGDKTVTTATITKF